MSDVFISYAREDRARVRVIADALEERGLSVWWDPKIKTGAGFRAEITEALESASAVIVVWSEHSVASRFVCDEADDGAGRDCLFPVLLDLVDIPLGFRQIQTADLTHWRGGHKNKAFKEFIGVVESFVVARAPTSRSRRPDPQPEPEPAVAPRIEPKPERAPPPKPAPERKAEPPKEPRRPATAKRTHVTTGAKTRFALLWRAVLLAALIAGGFGALAHVSDFVFESYRPILIGALAILVFISRYFTFGADRRTGAASLHLLSRSYLALLFFSLIAIAPLLMEARLYAAALQAVRIAGVEGADINAIAYSSDGGRIVTASDDGTARVWDAETGVQLSIFKGHRIEDGVSDDDWVWGAGFSPDGARAITASRDLTARIWDAKSGRELFVLEGHLNSVYDAAFHPDGAMAATASGDGTVRFWNTEDGGQIGIVVAHNARVVALDFSPTGAAFATASRDGTAKVWSMASYAPTATLSGGHAGAVNDVAFAPDGGRLATAGEDGRAVIWGAGGELLRVIDHAGEVFSVAFVDGGRALATGDIAGIVRLWDPRSGELLRELTGHVDGVRALAAHPDAARLASASRDNTARVWDVASGDEIQIFGHVEPALAVPFTLDRAPYLMASRAAVPLDVAARPAKAGTIAGKGALIAAAALLVGVVLKGLFWIVRARRIARWSIVGVTGLAALYIAALIVTSLPIQAFFLWLTAAFAPAALFALLRWIAVAPLARR